MTLKRRRKDGAERAESIRPDEVIAIMAGHCEGSAGFKWHEGGPMEFRNSDGSTVVDYSGRLTQGLVHSGTDDKADGVICCYEFNGTIVVHLDGTKSLLRFCVGVAEKHDLELSIS